MEQTQKAYIQSESGVMPLIIPAESDEVLPGVIWGNVAGFPTIAYWFYKVNERRYKDSLINYQLGESLLEEIGACLLGGHGIPAENGMASYEHMKSKGCFTGRVHSEELIYSWLSEPIAKGNKTFKYRFAKQKSCYLYHAIKALSEQTPPLETGIALRDWLVGIKGIGLKTASWIARNWLRADDVAILDIHIYRAGILAGFFTEELTVEKHYLKLEEIFVTLASQMKIKTSELDAVMWFEMQQYKSIHKLLEQRKSSSKPRSKTPTYYGTSDPQQIALA